MFLYKPFTLCAKEGTDIQVGCRGGIVTFTTCMAITSELQDKMLSFLAYGWLQLPLFFFFFFFFLLADPRQCFCSDSSRHLLISLRL